MRRELRNYFITGLLVFVPLVGTIYVLRVAFNFFDGILMPIVSAVVGQRIPGLSLLVTVAIIVLMGAITTQAAGKRVLDAFESRLLRIPIVSGIYSMVKEASNALLSDKEGRLKNVVLVEYPRKGLYSIAFTTSSTVGEIQEKTTKKTINLFLPSTPNPTTGFLIMVAEDEVIPLDMTMDEAFKVILSGGLTELSKEKKG